MNGNKFQINYVIEHKPFITGTEDLKSALKYVKPYINDKACQYIEIIDNDAGKIYLKEQIREMTWMLLEE